jgi:hypothetical protein
MTCAVPRSAGRIADCWTLRAALLTLLYLAVLSAAVIGAYIPNQQALSPFDEWVYLDAVDKVTDLQIPQQGELIGQAALEVSSCRGVFVWGPTGSPCGGPYVSTDYPLGGVTSADIHPPTYFAMTAAAAGLIRAMGLSDDLLTSARIVGAFWLMLGLVGITVLARELGLPFYSGVGAATLAAVLPITRYNNSYITPDALNIAVGAFVLLTAVRIARGAWPWWALAVAGAVAGGIKTQNALALGVAIVFLIINALMARSADVQSWRRHLLASLGAITGYLVVQGGWLVVRSLRSLGDSPVHDDAGGRLTLELAAQETTAFILRLGLGATEDGQPVPTYAYILTALLVAGLVGAVLYRPLQTVHWQLGTATTLLVFLGSPILLVAQQLAISEVVPSPARYGSSLIAGACIVTAGAFDTQRRSVAFFGVTALIAATVVVTNVAS